VPRDVARQPGGSCTLRLDLQIITPRQLTTPNGERCFEIGCKFVATPGIAERTLQRVATQTETKWRTLAPRW
jgi:hypothetical protein